MKKIISILCSIVLFFTISGCSGGANQLKAVYDLKKNFKLNNELKGDTIQTIVQNDFFQLNVIPKTGYFEVTSLKNGNTFTSFPKSIDLENISDNVSKSTLVSSVCIEYGDMSNHILGTALSYTDSVLTDGHKFYQLENGFVDVYKFPKVGITVPIKVTLSDEGFKVEILTDDIKEESEYKIISISLLNGFGAGEYDAEGYMVVPDGSGAVIEFSNGKHSYPSLQIPIYGKDPSVNEIEKDFKKASMPIFGLKNGDTAFLAIIERGDAHSVVNANIAGSMEFYNNIYSRFVIRDSSTVSVSDTNVGYSNKNFIIFDETKQTLDNICVNYCVLEGEKANYTGMAKTYGSFLAKESKINENENKDILFLDFQCTVGVQQDIFGIKNQKTVSTAKFDDIKDFINKFDKSKINLMIDGWNKTDINDDIHKNSHAVNVIGGDDGLKKLSKCLVSKDIDLFAAIDITHIKPSSKNAARFINKKAMSIYPIKRNTLKNDLEGIKQNLISPKLFDKSIDKISNSWLDKKIGLSLSNSTEFLYSDFGNNYSKRQQSEEYYKNSYSKVASNGISMASYEPNAYEIPYITTAFNLGGKFNNYDVTDYQIPFYQLAVSELIDYSYEPINLSSNKTRAFMKSLEYGSGILYSLITENADIISESNCPELYCCDAEFLYDDIVAKYQSALDFYSKVGHTFVAHSRIDKDIYLSTYEKGKAVFNYSGQDYLWNDTVIPSGSYIIVEGGK